MSDSEIAYFGNVGIEELESFYHDLDDWLSWLDEDSTRVEP